MFCWPQLRPEHLLAVVRYASEVLSVGQSRPKDSHIGFAGSADVKIKASGSEAAGRSRPVTRRSETEQSSLDPLYL